MNRTNKKARLRSLQRPARARAVLKKRIGERRELAAEVMSTEYKADLVKAFFRLIESAPYTTTAIAAFATAVDELGQERIAKVLRAVCQRTALIEAGEM